MKELKYILKEGLFDDVDLDITDQELAKRYLKNWAKGLKDTYLEWLDQDTIKVITNESVITIDSEVFNKAADINPKIKFIFNNVYEIRIKDNLKNVGLELEYSGRRTWRAGTISIHNGVELDNCIITCPRFDIECLYKNINCKIKNTHIDCQCFYFFQASKQTMNALDFSGSIIKSNVVVGNMEFLKKKYPEPFKTKKLLERGPDWIKDFDIRKIYPFDFECNNFLFEKDSRKVIVLMHHDGSEWIQAYAILSVGDRMGHIKALQDGYKPRWVNPIPLIRMITTDAWIKTKKKI